MVGGATTGRFEDRLRDDDAAHQRVRAFEFRLDDGVSSSVWFGGELLTIIDVVDMTWAAGLTGHELMSWSSEQAATAGDDG